MFEHDRACIPNSSGKKAKERMTFITQFDDKNKLSSALAYAQAGKYLFPLLPRGKTPLTAKGFHDASKDLAAITAWWQPWPEANIGLPTGKINGFWVLDIDGEDGEYSLRQLEQEHGKLPPTVEVITGGGGRHLYFGLPAQGSIRNSAGRLGKGLDVRGDGGYVVVPPSVHETGKAYSFSIDSSASMASAPAWLLSLVRVSAASKPAPVSEWRTLAKSMTEGGRNDAVARIAGKLLRCRLEPRLALELCLAWNEARCTPPLSSEEVTRTVDSIAGRELARRGGRV